MRACIGVFHNGFADGEAFKGLSQIDWLVGVAELQGAHRMHGGMSYQTFGKCHQVLIVPISCIKLHHGEFGVVSHRNAFIAKVAVDFKHPLKAAHHQAFQVELGGNAQKHLLV